MTIFFLLLDGGTIDLFIFVFKRIDHQRFDIASVVNLERVISYFGQAVGLIVLDTEYLIISAARSPSFNLFTKLVLLFHPCMTVAH